VSDSPYLTQAEAAQYLRVSVATFKNVVRRAVPCARVGRKPLFKVADLDAYVSDHTHFTVPRASRGKSSARGRVRANDNAAAILQELG
jgi:excisionase family DNA binding protein